MDEKLILKSIHDLLGEHFYIPYYQRGYRWTTQQVNDLLDDIWAFANKREQGFYCLQPVVVKKKEWIDNGTNIHGWEVVDGQQRLTTLYIIIRYLAKEFLKVESLVAEYGKEAYSLRYETRPQSGAFLQDIQEDKSNIDFYHIWKAYKTVGEWFGNGLNTKDRTDRNRFLDTVLGKKGDERSVQVIWYVVDSNATSVELFTRLNVGKIPLTNAELIKALFLSDSSFEEFPEEKRARMKMEVSQIWDSIEQKLREPEFWAFVTNQDAERYSNRIELLFDVFAQKKENGIDSFSTFLFFMRRAEEGSTALWEVWLQVEQYYLTICQWFKEKDHYHRVGFLIAMGESLHSLIQHSLTSKKSHFQDELIKRIKRYIHKADIELEALSYEDGHSKQLENILLLYNVETIRVNQNITEFYPFKSHKSIHWSLEHIHAQNTESIDRTKQELWLKWLGYHRAIIAELAAQEQSESRPWNALLSEVDDSNNDKLNWSRFDQLSRKIIHQFSGNVDEHSYNPHSISNLALLGHGNNAALNNSVFEVKRRKIIQMDQEGIHIPLCTRRVFLRYYNTDPLSEQTFFWGQKERDNYLRDIKQRLETYLN